jgi:hypothetical protein
MSLQSLTRIFQKNQGLGCSCNKFAVRITFGLKIVKCSLISFTLTYAIQIIFIAVSDYATAAWLFRLACRVETVLPLLPHIPPPAARFAKVAKYEVLLGKPIISRIARHLDTKCMRWGRGTSAVYSTIWFAILQNRILNRFLKIWFDWKSISKIAIWFEIWF